MNQDRQATIIKIAVVSTAIPRWTGALLAAEGVPLPPDWLETWRVISAVLSIGMAITEAFAISYILNAWRVQKDQGARWLVVMGIATLVVFTMVLTPYIAANVREMTMAEVLGSGWLWWAWSISVASSTGVTVLGVGYAEKHKTVTTRVQPVQVATPAPQPVAELPQTVAKIADFDRIFAELPRNGAVSRDTIKARVTDAGYLLPSESTIRNWEKKVNDAE